LKERKKHVRGLRNRSHDRVIRALLRNKVENPIRSTPIIHKSYAWHNNPPIYWLGTLLSWLGTLLPIHLDPEDENESSLAWSNQSDVSHLYTVDEPHTHVLDKDLMGTDCRSYFPVEIQLRPHCIYQKCLFLWQQNKDQLPRICLSSPCASHHPKHGDSNRDHGYHHAYCGSDMCI